MARAPKKTPAKKARKSNAGRPPKYDAKLHPKLAEAYVVAGKNVVQIAAELEISVSTFYDWRENKPEFSEALARAETSKNNIVATSLYRRATGYNYRTSQVKIGEGGVIVERTRRTHHVAPETSAAMAFLTNRDKDNWKQKQVLEHDVSDSLADRLDRATRRHRESRGED
ncbi:MAG: hypothetical protein AAF661_04950 [Pseudomonadota bacterium]